MQTIFTRIRKPLVQRLIILFIAASLWLILPVIACGLLLHTRYSPLALLNTIVPIVAHPGCQNTACDGKDPITEGCDRDATTQASLKMIYNGVLGSPLVTNALTLTTGMMLGVLERRHSASCGASWARITDTIPALRKGLPATGVSLYVPQDGYLYRTSPGTFFPISAYSDMLSDRESFPITGYVYVGMTAYSNAVYYVYETLR